MTARRIAVLVDGDNVSAKFADKVFTKAQTMGRVDIARVYADASRPSEWSGKARFRLIHAGVGKNATDILLCLDAMELAFLHEVDSFVVATSDGDFSHLAHRLRERGLHVLGMGEAKAPDGFRMACSGFEVLKVPKKKAPETPEPAAANQINAKPSERQPSNLSEIDEQIVKVLSKFGKGKSGMPVQHLGVKMNSQYSKSTSDLPTRNWTCHLKANPELYKLSIAEGVAMVFMNPMACIKH